MHIFVKPLDGSVFTLHVDPLDTIESVKNKIPDISKYVLLLLTGKITAPDLRCASLNPYTHRLTFAGHDLQNGLTLVDSNIQNESTLTVGSYIVLLFPFCWESFAETIRHCTGLRLRGGMIPQSCPLPSAFTDEPTIATQKEDKRKVFNLTHPGQIQIVIKTMDEHSIKIIIAEAKMIDYLKAKIEEMLSVPVKEQRLLYSGLELEDHHKLSDYALKHDDTVLLGSHTTFFVKISY